MNKSKSIYSYRGLLVLIGVFMLFGSLLGCEQDEPVTEDQREANNQPEANKQVAQQIYDVWDGADEDVLDDLIAEDVILHTPDYMRGTLHGREAYKNNLHMVQAALEDMFFRAHTVVAEDDKVIAYATVGGTHEGEFMGIEPTGTSVEVEDFVLYQFEDGKVAEVISRPDYLSLFMQLGVIELPGE